MTFGAIADLWCLLHRIPHDLKYHKLRLVVRPGYISRILFRDAKRTYLAYSLQADTIQAGISDAPRYSTLPCLTKISRESINSGIEVEWSHYLVSAQTSSPASGD
jgi:hypothetical protein